jgi:phosphatidylglycerophosphate synthase
MSEQGARKRATTPPSKREDETRTKSDDDRAQAIEKLKTKRLVIPEEGLKMIAEHKYVAGTYTPMDNLLNNYFWTPLVVLLPKWIAPNAVTVSGLIIQVCGFVLVAYFCADFHAPAPQWTYGFAAFTIFAYQTLDALDGKQARRTQASSPLGQLFDHGCDSVVTIFIGMLTAMCLRLGFSVRCVTFVFCMLLPFWMAQWSEYHAHVLPTSIAGLVGVTEAQFVSMAIALANVFSTDFWEVELGIWMLPSWWCGRPACPAVRSDALVAAQLLLAVCGIAQCCLAVGTKSSNKVTATLQTVPIIMLAIVGYAWCIVIPHAHPRLVLFSLGVSFSFMTCKMIVAAMSRTDYNIFQPALVPLPIIFTISKLQLLPRHDDVLLGGYVAVTIYAMAQWIRRVIEEISQYIGIHTFRLGPRRK